MSVRRDFTDELGIMEIQVQNTHVNSVYQNLLFKHKNTRDRAPEEKKQMEKLYTVLGQADMRLRSEK